MLEQLTIQSTPICGKISMKYFTYNKFININKLKQTSYRMNL